MLLLPLVFIQAAIVVIFSFRLAYDRVPERYITL